MTLTEDENNLLNQLEEHAANMSYLNALMKSFLEINPFARDADHAHRYYALQCYTGICDLALHYSQSVHSVIDQYYQENNR